MGNNALREYCINMVLPAALQTCSSYVSHQIPQCMFDDVDPCCPNPACVVLTECAEASTASTRLAGSIRAKAFGTTACENTPLLQHAYDVTHPACDSGVAAMDITSCTDTSRQKRS